MSHPPAHPPAPGLHRTAPPLMPFFSFNLEDMLVLSLVRFLRAEKYQGSATEGYCKICSKGTDGPDEGNTMLSHSTLFALSSISVHRGTLQLGR